MAMLAEPRRKQKWTLNPRGKDWSKDSSKFGQKLLEKMGWSSGKGLGVNLDGMTDHIKISYKNDSRGMGFKDRGDQWTQHESHFNSLLKSLEGSDNSSDCVKKEDESETTGFGFTGFQQSEALTTVSKLDLSGISLEEKSKKSRARVHYHKFTRGKDISKYSEKDLANIFGKKTLSTPEPVAAPQMNYGVVKFDEPEEKPDPTFGITTIQSKQSMADYFRSKMPASFQKRKFKVGSDGVLCAVKDNEDPILNHNFCGFKMEDKDDESNTLLNNGDVVSPTDEENIKKSKKKKKKSRKSVEEVDVDLENIESKTVEENELEQTEKPKSKKKKSKKDVEQENCESEEKEKRKKKKKRETEEVVNDVPENIADCKEESIKKKKKKNKEADKGIENDVVIKKNKKRKAEMIDNEENVKKRKEDCEEIVLNNIDEPSEPKKKKKKSKKHDI